VPLTFSDNSTMADQFKRLTSLILNQSAPQKGSKGRSALSLSRFASMW
jgi:hypothetical protein